jgi:hypothetical protein
VRKSELETGRIHAQEKRATARTTDRAAANETSGRTNQNRKPKPGTASEKSKQAGGRTRSELLEQRLRGTRSELLQKFQTGAVHGSGISAG